MDASQFPLASTTSTFKSEIKIIVRETDENLKINKPMHFQAGAHQIQVLENSPHWADVVPGPVLLETA